MLIYLVILIIIDQVQSWFCRSLMERGGAPVKHYSREPTIFPNIQYLHIRVHLHEKERHIRSYLSKIFLYSQWIILNINTRIVKLNWCSSFTLKALSLQQQYHLKIRSDGRQEAFYRQSTIELLGNNSRYLVWTWQRLLALTLKYKLLCSVKQ